MNTLHRQRTSGYAGLTGLFLCVAAIAQGCGNDNPEPTTPVVTGGTNTGGSGGKGGSGAKGGSGGDSGADNPGGSDASGGTGAKGGSTSTGGTGAKGGKGGTGGTGAKGGKGGTGNTTGGTGNTGNEGGDGNQGGDGPVVDCSPQGEGKDRCYPCAPTDGENVEFLNHCNDASCSHFDNESRIEGFTTPLPPL